MIPLAADKEWIEKVQVPKFKLVRRQNSKLGG
jgi:hypothetical protein